ncbi:EVE domain-containing protein [Hirsutella rhossiliensis]|uniref:Thymocyte nuclear protein 1 n=1 Tax=Hirsutella rhossiliensis TaxID=111463 RepID=A0A9P8SPT6_9HYPO|nr:EVE domain-containing protein [Hirsutella rhossiliensis]KAH0968541.1 EVE domain-containing protein [Hirsutella rhossiliensis]
MAGARKRGATAPAADAGFDEPAPKRRSSRQAAAAAAAAAPEQSVDAPPRQDTRKPAEAKTGKREARRASQGNARGRGVRPKRDHDAPAAKKNKATPATTSRSNSTSQSRTKPERSSDDPKPAEARRSDDGDDISAVNPEAPRHDGEWYWLMKAEPETRLENGVDVSFSIDDLRAKTKPEGWDGIRAYAARNHMRTMNVGDKAFFYHSNCKDPGIAGVMEIVKEFSPDQSALIPGAPYYDPSSTKENPRWSLVHVKFRRKFAVPISLRELRELGKSGGALEGMQMLKQLRLSVSRVSSGEWAVLCRLADDKAAEAGLEHDEGREPGK